MANTVQRLKVEIIWQNCNIEQHSIYDISFRFTVRFTTLNSYDITIFLSYISGKRMKM